MLKIINNLLTLWNTNSIRYCHWKSTNHLDDTVEARTDIDVLVDRRVWDKAERLAENVGFMRLDTVPLRSYPGIKDLVARDISGAWVHLHLHYQLTLGDRWVKAYWLPLEERILERSKFVDKYNSYVINPYDELYIFCARMSLKFRRPFTKKKVWQELEHILDECKFHNDDNNISLPVTLEGLDKIVSYALKTPDPRPRELNKYSPKVRRELSAFRRFGGVSFCIRSLARQLYRYRIEFKRRILKRYDTGRRRLPKGGAIVAVLGIDGSGKTTLVNRLAKDIGAQINVRRVYLGYGKSGSWYRRLVFSALGTKARWKGHKKAQAHADNPSKDNPPWYYALWLLLGLIDKKKNLRKAIGGRANGAVVLSDRWTQLQIQHIHDAPRLYGREGLKRLALCAANREYTFWDQAETVSPDLVIRLNVSPEAVCKRRPGESSIKEAERKIQRLNQLEWENSAVAEVDGDQSPDEVQKAAVFEIWNYLRGEINENEDS